MKKDPVVRYRAQTDELSCPYGDVQRIVTGGEGGIANVHVVTVTRGDTHFHEGYDQVYYVLSGNGTIQIDGDKYKLEPGGRGHHPSRYGPQPGSGQRYPHGVHHLRHPAHVHGRPAGTTHESLISGKTASLSFQSEAASHQTPSYSLEGHEDVRNRRRPRLLEGSGPGQRC